MYYALLRKFDALAKSGDNCQQVVLAKSIFEVLIVGASSLSPRRLLKANIKSSRGK